jgi:hypothetical protein
MLRLMPLLHPASAGFQLLLLAALLLLPLLVKGSHTRCCMS